MSVVFSYTWLFFAKVHLEQVDILGPSAEGYIYIYSLCGGRLRRFHRKTEIKDVKSMSDRRILPITKYSSQAMIRQSLAN